MVSIKFYCPDYPETVKGLLAYDSFYVFIAIIMRDISAPPDQDGSMPESREDRLLAGFSALRRLHVDCYLLYFGFLSCSRNPFREIKGMLQDSRVHDPREGFRPDQRGSGRSPGSCSYQGIQEATCRPSSASARFPSSSERRSICIPWNKRVTFPGVRMMRVWIITSLFDTSGAVMTLY